MAHVVDMTKKCWARRGHDVDAADPEVCHEQEKCPVVPESYTVGHPGCGGTEIKRLNVANEENVEEFDEHGLRCPVTHSP